MKPAVIRDKTNAGRELKEITCLYYAIVFIKCYDKGLRGEDFFKACQEAAGVDRVKWGHIKETVEQLKKSEPSHSSKKRKKQLISNKRIKRYLWTLPRQSLRTDSDYHKFFDVVMHRICSNEELHTAYLKYVLHDDGHRNEDRAVIEYPNCAHHISGFQYDMLCDHYVPNGKSKKQKAVNNCKKRVEAIMIDLKEDGGCLRFI